MPKTTLAEEIAKQRTLTHASWRTGFADAGIAFAHSRKLVLIQPLNKYGVAYNAGAWYAEKLHTLLRVISAPIAQNDEPVV